MAAVTVVATDDWGCASRITLYAALTRQHTNYSLHRCPSVTTVMLSKFIRRLLTRGQESDVRAYPVKAAPRCAAAGLLIRSGCDLAKEVQCQTRHGHRKRPIRKIFTLGYRNGAADFRSVLFGRCRRVHLDHRPPGNRRHE